MNLNELCFIVIRQVATRYGTAVRLLSAAPLSGYMPVVWLDLVRCKRHYYESVARLHLAMALLSSKAISCGSTLDRETRLLVNSHSRVAECGTRKAAMYADTEVVSKKGRILLGKYLMQLCKFVLKNLLLPQITTRY